MPTKARAEKGRAGLINHRDGDAAPDRGYRYWCQPDTEALPYTVSLGEICERLRVCGEDLNTGLARLEAGGVFQFGKFKYCARGKK